MRWYKTVGRMNVLAVIALCFILMPKLPVEAAGSDTSAQSAQTQGTALLAASVNAAKQTETDTDTETNTKAADTDTAAAADRQTQTAVNEKTAEQTETVIDEKAAVQAETPADETADSQEQAAAGETASQEVTADENASVQEETPEAEEGSEEDQAPDELERQQNAALYTAKHTFNKLIAEGVTEDEAIELVNQELENVADIVEKAKTDPEAAKILEDWQEAAEDCMAALEEQEEEEEETDHTDFVYPATDEEIRLLSALIYCEAGNQSREGKVAVGNVVLNRIRSGKFPNTMKEVIYQRGQFSPVGSGWLSWVLRKGEIPESCREAAIAALQGEAPVGNAIFFMRKNLHYTGMIIGAHCFWGTV